MSISLLDINNRFHWIENEYPFKELVTQITDQSDKYITILNTVKKYVPAGGSVLDFGSGTAVAASLLSKEGFDVTGIDDLNDPMHGGEKGIIAIEDFYKKSNVKFIKSNGELSIQSLVGPEVSYDMIMCHDVFEHLHDSPKVLVEDMLAMLKPGGKLYLSIPNAASVRKRVAILRGKTNYAPYAQYYDWPGTWRGHVREYVIGDLEILANKNNLRIEELRGCDHMTQKLPKKYKTPYMFVTNLVPSLKDCVMLVATKV